MVRIARNYTAITIKSHIHELCVRSAKFFRPYDLVMLLSITKTPGYGRRINPGVVNGIDERRNVRCVGIKTLPSLSPVSRTPLYLKHKSGHLAPE